MATVEFTVYPHVALDEFPVEASLCAGTGRAVAKEAPKKRMHRIQEVRRQQGVSLRSAARSLGTDIRTVRSQETESADLRISDLHKWQKALDVPVAELLVESAECLSGPVLERARMIRLMKTAAAILERAPTPQVSRMAQMLVEQLVEIMPELRDVGPWHQVGQRRSAEEVGRVAERRFNDSMFGGDEGDE